MFVVLKAKLNNLRERERGREWGIEESNVIGVRSMKNYKLQLKVVKDIKL